MNDLVLLWAVEISDGWAHVAVILLLAVAGWMALIERRTARTAANTEGLPELKSEVHHHGKQIVRVETHLRLPPLPKE